MFDIFGSTLTPSLARQFIRFSKFSKLELPPDILAKAEENLIQTSQTGKRREFLQHLEDNHFRGVVLDDGHNSGLELVASYLKEIDRKNVVMVTHRSNSARQEEAILVLSGLEFRRVTMAQYVPQNGDQILFIANQYPVVEDYEVTFFGSESILSFSKTNQVFDSSTLSSIIHFYNIINGNTYYDTTMNKIMESTPAEKQADLLKLFGVIRSHNSVDI